MYQHANRLHYIIAGDRVLTHYYDKLYIQAPWWSGRREQRRLPGLWLAFYLARPRWLGQSTLCPVPDCPVHQGRWGWWVYWWVGSLGYQWVGQLLTLGIQVLKDVQHSTSGKMLQNKYAVYCFKIAYVQGIYIYVYTCICMYYG